MATVALAGVFNGAQTKFSAAAGPLLLIYAFEAVIIGGLGSLWGTLAGGIVLGVAQNRRRRDRTGLEAARPGTSCSSPCSWSGRPACSGGEARGMTDVPRRSAAATAARCRP